MYANAPESGKDLIYTLGHISLKWISIEISVALLASTAMKRIIIIDYGLGNLRSVTRGLERAGAQPEVTSEASQFARADGLVLPGVGAFKSGMRNIKDKKKALLRAVDEGTPVLGICLGMQMLLTASDEGQGESGPIEGLNLLKGHVKRFNFGPTSEKLKIPHMGWNRLDVVKENALVQGADGALRDGLHQQPRGGQAAHNGELPEAARDRHGQRGRELPRRALEGGGSSSLRSGARDCAGFVVFT